jgi:hypothetical protein
MNDFTREELNELRASRCYHMDDNFPHEDTLFMKLQSMIDNYCEHEICEEDYNYQPLRCKACLEIVE